MDQQTKAQLEIYQKEIDVLEIRRKKEFIASMVVFGISFLLLIALIISLIVNKSGDYGLGVLSIVLIIVLPLSIFIGVLILIIRSLVTDVKIANRKRIINRENSIEEEINKPHDENNKIGF